MSPRRPIDLRLPIAPGTDRDRIRAMVAVWNQDPLFRPSCRTGGIAFALRK
jgi:hypothetical protein